MGGALALESLDVTVPQALSVAVDFFRAYPRLGAGSKAFSISASYRTDLYRLGVPYMAAGIVLLLAALIANFYFYTRRSVVPGADDTHESDPDERDAVGRSFLLFSCFLNLGIILCIAMSFTSAFSMRAAANGARDVVKSAKLSVHREVAAPAQLMQDFATSAERTDTRDVEEEVRSAAQMVKQLLLARKTTVEQLVKAATDIMGHLDAVDNEIQYLSVRYFWFTFTVLATVICGLLLSVISDASTPDAKRLRISIFAFLFVPMAATWAHTAISTWVAVASADFCQSTSEYHQALIYEAEGKIGGLRESNVFLQYDLQCPAQSSSGRNLREFNTLIGSSQGIEKFSGGLSAVTGSEVGPDSWSESATWIQDMIEEYETCGSQLKFGAHLTHFVCADHGTSAVTAVGQLWLCSCGLTLLFSAIVALLTWGHPPSEFCSGRELLYIYGAPELISAFGDVQDVLSRRSTFRKLYSCDFTDAKLVWSDSDRSATSRRTSSKAFSIDDVESMSVERPRRNAYTSHALKDRKLDLD